MQSRLPLVGKLKQLCIWDLLHTAVTSSVLLTTARLRTATESRHVDTAVTDRISRTVELRR